MAETLLHDALASGETVLVLLRPDRPDATRTAIGVKRGLWIPTAGGNTTAQLDDFIASSGGAVFGWLGYDLKNAFERLETRHPDRIGFGDAGLFEPHTILEGSAGFDALASARLGQNETKITLTPRVSKAQYLEDVRALQRHIQLGDIYEVNYCQELYAEGVTIDPLAVFERLVAATEAPHSALLHHKGSWLLCASPERYLQRNGNRLISQPIKGTVRRGATAEEDLALAAHLASDPKERAENIMITDLVRNDLARAGIPGTVQVDELCGIYSFKTVHQMISTVSAEVTEAHRFGHIVASTFPMGSMTGAPKVSAMGLIDRYEHFARGLYSGSVGVIDPSGDFDFNVVIRSVLYNAHTGYLSIRIGGAITALADAEQEYEECMLKARAVVGALGCTFTP